MNQGLVLLKIRTDQKLGTNYNKINLMSAPEGGKAELNK